MPTPQHHRVRHHWCLAATAIALLGACSGDGRATDPSLTTASTSSQVNTTEEGPDPTTTPSGPTLTDPLGPSSSVMTTNGPVSTMAPTSTVVPATTNQCPALGSTNDVEYAFPSGLSSLVGIEIRTGGHSCFERIVLELAPSDSPSPVTFPGYWIRYDDGPVYLGESDETVEIAGNATLLITVTSWMYEADTQGRPTEYAGAIDLFPTNVSFIEEIRLVDNWEGVHTWAIGLDREHAFVVTRLSSPDRLVIDLQR